MVFAFSISTLTLTRLRLPLSFVFFFSTGSTIFPKTFGPESFSTLVLISVLDDFSTITSGETTISGKADFTTILSFSASAFALATTAAAFFSEASFACASKSNFPRTFKPLISGVFTAPFTFASLSFVAATTLASAAWTSASAAAASAAWAAASAAWAAAFAAASAEA